MSYSIQKLSRIGALLLAVLCFALPVFSEEGDELLEQAAQTVTQEQTQQETTFILPEIVGAEALREEAGGEELPVNNDTPVHSQYKLDASYSGEVVYYNGTVAAAGRPDEQGLYTLAEGQLEYNPANRTYRWYCGDNYVVCNFPAGAVVNNTNPIHLTANTGLNLEVYRNGDPVEEDYSDMKKPGHYVIKLSDARGLTASYNLILVDKYISSIAEVSLPVGFRFTSVEVNGTRQTLDYSNYYRLTVDGSYVLNWSSDLTGASYTTRFILDTEPPTLALPEVKDGVADGPVGFTDLEEGATILCEHGQQVRTITDPNATLTEGGAYTLWVMDRAGNRTVYRFTIRNYLNLQGGTAIFLLAAALAALFLYDRRLRNHLRVD